MITLEGRGRGMHEVHADVLSKSVIDRSSGGRDIEEVFGCTWDDIAWIWREPSTTISGAPEAINVKLGVHLGDDRTEVLPKSRLCRPTGTGVMAVQRCASVSCTFTNGAEFPLRSSLIVVL